MRYFTRKLELVSDNYWVIVSGNIFLSLIFDSTLSYYSVACIIWTSIVMATVLRRSTFEFHWLIITADFLLPCHAPLPRLSNVNWLNFHNKQCNSCNSMMSGNYSTLVIGDSIIAGFLTILVFGRDTLNRYML